MDQDTPWPADVTADDHPTPDDCETTATSDSPVPSGFYAGMADGS